MLASCPRDVPLILLFNSLHLSPYLLISPLGHSLLNCWFFSAVCSHNSLFLHRLGTELGCRNSLAANPLVTPTRSKASLWSPHPGLKTSIPLKKHAPPSPLPHPHPTTPYALVKLARFPLQPLPPSTSTRLSARLCCSRTHRPSTPLLTVLFRHF